MQKELFRATGQHGAKESGDTVLKAPVNGNTVKPRPHTRPTGPPTSVAARLDVACRAVTASVEGLKTVSRNVFAHDAKMRVCARSLGAVVTEFVKLHTQLEPSLSARRPTLTTQSSQGSFSRQPQASVSRSGQVKADHQGVRPTPSASHSQMPVSGFFGSASLQSKGSGVSCTEVSGTSGSKVAGGGAESMGHSEAGQDPAAETQSPTTIDHDTSLKDLEAKLQPAELSSLGKAGNSSTDGVETAEGRDSLQLPTDSASTHQEPPQTHSTSGGGTCATTTHSVQAHAVRDCPSRCSTTSISSSVFSEAADAESSQAPINNEYSGSHGWPSFSQPASPRAGTCLLWMADGENKALETATQE